MPLKWTPELDAILLHGVFEECKISFTKALCTKLAARVTATGSECSYKAVENRLYSWKKNNAGGPTNGTAPNTPSKPSTPKTPVSGRGRAKGSTKKKAQVRTDSLGDDYEDEVLSPSMSRKRGYSALKSASYAESDAPDDEEKEKYTPTTKKVKKEENDDQEGRIFTTLYDDDGEDQV